jgi:lactoylglutathione lyase
VVVWRVEDGTIVEHWACRDDMGLVDQLRDP